MDNNQNLNQNENQTPVSSEVTSEPVAPAAPVEAPVEVPVQETPQVVPEPTVVPEAPQAPVEPQAPQTPQAPVGQNPQTVQGQAQVGFQVGQQVKKPDNKVVIIVCVVLAVIVAGGFGINSLFNTLGGGSNALNKVSREVSSAAKAVNEEKIKNNVKYEVVKELSDGKILVSVTNNNKKDFVSFDIDVKFFDADKVKIDSESIYGSCIPPKTTIYAVRYTTNNDYASYEIDDSSKKVYTSTSSKCIDYNGKYVIEDTKEITSYGRTEVYGIFTNNTGKKVSASFVAAFKKGEETVGYNTVYFTGVANGEKSKDKIIVPYDSNYEQIDFDTVEFLLTNIYAD